MIAEPARAALVRLAAGNRRFVAAVAAAVGPDGLREALSTAEPFAVVLGCSDSRVVPETIFGETFGKLFVVRVAGNVAESIELASIEYAIGRWGCPLVIVLAHTQCGAVACAIDREGERSVEPVQGGHVSSLLVPLRSNIALAPADGAGPGEDPWRSAVLANARAVAESLPRRSELLARRVARGELVVVAALYDVETGLVEYPGAPDALLAELAGEVTAMPDGSPGTSAARPSGR